jgi:hypothetical protein
VHRSTRDSGRSDADALAPPHRRRAAARAHCTAKVRGARRGGGRGAAHLALCLDVHASLYQQLHHAQVAPFRSPRQRRFAQLRTRAAVRNA